MAFAEPVVSSRLYSTFCSMKSTKKIHKNKMGKNFGGSLQYSTLGFSHKREMRHQTGSSRRTLHGTHPHRTHSFSLTTDWPSALPLRRCVQQAKKISSLSLFPLPRPPRSCHHPCCCPSCLDERGSLGVPCFPFFACQPLLNLG